MRSRESGLFLWENGYFSRFLLEKSGNFMKKLLFLCILSVLILWPVEAGAFGISIIKSIAGFNVRSFAADIGSGILGFGDDGGRLDNVENNISDIPLIQGNSILASHIPLAPKIRRYSISKGEVFVVATAYSSTPEETDSSPFITASGTYVREGVVAANFLPFGTVIKIPDLFGDKTFVVEDRMNKRYFWNVDIWFPTKNAAREFGVKRVRVEIVS